MTERGPHVQANVSAEQRASAQDPRVPLPHEDRRRPVGAEAQARQGPEAIDGLGKRSPKGDPGERFTWQDRLHLSREFEAAYSRGFKVPSRSFVLFILPNKSGRSRLGVTVSRKIGDAVVRNRARRKMREIFRKRRHLRAAGLDIVVHARPAIAGAGLRVLESEFSNGLARFERMSQ